MFDTEQVEGAADALTHQILDRPWARIKRRHRWKDHRARIGGAAHQVDVTGVIGGFTDHQNQPAALLEADVGGADDQVVGVGVGDSRQGFDGTRRNQHAPGPVRPTGNARGLVFVGMHHLGQGLDLVDADIGFDLDGASGDLGQDQVRRLPDGLEQSQCFDAVDGAGCAGHGDEDRFGHSCLLPGKGL